MAILIHDQNIAVDAGPLADRPPILDPSDPRCPPVGARYYATDTNQSFELRPGPTPTSLRVWVEIGSMVSTINVTGDVHVGGNTTLDGDLTVGGNTILGNAPTDTVQTSGSVEVGADLQVDGDTSLVGGLGVSGDVSILGNLDVSGTANFQSPVTASSLDVVGDLSVGNDLEVTGEIVGASGFHTLTEDFVEVGVVPHAEASMARFVSGGPFTSIMANKAGSILSTAIQLSAALGAGETITVQWRANGVNVPGTSVTVIAGQSSALLMIAQGVATFPAGALLEMRLTAVGVAGAPNANAGGIITQ